jgi:hypothetical protein
VQVSVGGHYPFEEVVEREPEVFLIDELFIDF